MKKLAPVFLLALAACSAPDAPPPPAPAAETPAPAPAATPGPVVVDERAAFWSRFDQALAGAHRSDANRARDVYRHPRETLEFFGLAPGMNVIEITPGGGWYTELLAPTLKGAGTLTAAIFDPAAVADEGARKYYEKNNQAFKDKLGANPELYGEVRLVEMGETEPKLGAPESADLVLTFRNVHNWSNGGNDAAMFKAFFEVLKPGATLGVVEHRAKAGTARETWIESGYVPEDYVIGLATAAGFELAARSEVNANPNDTTDHPKGVWTLPPSLSLKEVDRDKYLKIGESDRMTLRFVKPNAASATPGTTPEAPAATPAPDATPAG